MAISNKKSSKKTKVKNDFEFDEEEDIDICSLTEGEPILEGTLLRSFIFADPNSEPIEIPVNSNNTITTNNLNHNNIGNLPAGNIAIIDNAPADSISSKNSNVEVNENSSIKAASNLRNEKISSKSEPKEDILDYRFSKTNPSGRTPPVDGEAFDMVRCYTLRRSTVRILSKIKAIHQDDNVYLNTIVDEAIRYYYEYLKNSSI